MNNSHRVRYWDVIKGILIIAVVCVHSVGGWDFNNWTYFVPKDSVSFQLWMFERGILDALIGVFIFVSGYMITLKTTKNRKDYYTKRIKRIFVPYAIWSCIYTLVNVVVYHQKVTLLSLIIGTNGIQLYFFVVLLQLMILTPLIEKGIVRHPYRVVGIGFLIVGLNSLYQYTQWMKTHNCVSNEIILCTCWIGYYVLGMYFRNKEGQKTPGVFVSAILTAGTFALKMVQNYWLLGVTDNPTVSTSFNTPCNILYTIAVIFLVLSMKDMMEEKLQRRPKIGWTEWVGRHSMGFCLVHWLFECAMKTFIPMKESANHGFFVAWFLFVTISTLALSSISVWGYGRVCDLWKRER